MNWWWPRVVAPLLLMGLGALIGFWLGRSSEWLAWWVGLGAMLGFGVTVAWDTWRGQRILRWLRDHPDESVPIAAGLWGEAGYRIQKALRLREKALSDERETRQQFLSAIDASPNGVTLLDERDGIVWANVAARDHFSLDLERDRAQRITNLVRVPAFVDALGHPGAHESVTFNEPRRARKLTLIVRTHGPGRRMLLTQDVTDNERNEAMRRDFVANVSHEIRTPLTVLAASLESMQSLALETHERERMIELMQQQTLRMQTLVDDLLTLAKLEGSPLPAADRWFELDPLIARACADAEVLSAGRQMIVVDAIAGTRLAGEVSEWRSLLANLLGNAVRYTPSGGRITLHWQIDARGGELAVIDTGIGIEREHIARVTERFYRVDSSRSRDTGGTGLGLSIVKHVAQRHAAELDIQSEPGKGTTFRVRVPAARVQRGPAEKPAAATKVVPIQAAVAPVRLPSD